MYSHPKQSVHNIALDILNCAEDSLRFKSKKHQTHCRKTYGGKIYGYALDLIGTIGVEKVHWLSANVVPF